MLHSLAFWIAGRGEGIVERNPGQGVGAARSAARTRPLDAKEAIYARVRGSKDATHPLLSPDDRGRLVPLAGEGRRGVAHARA